MAKPGYRAFNTDLPIPLREVVDLVRDQYGGDKMIWDAWALFAFFDGLTKERIDEASERMNAWLAGGAPYPISPKAVDKLVAQWRQGKLVAYAAQVAEAEADSEDPPRTRSNGRRDAG